MSHDLIRVLHKPVEKYEFLIGGEGGYATLLSSPINLCTSDIFFMLIVFKIEASRQLVMPAPIHSKIWVRSHCSMAASTTQSKKSQLLDVGLLVVMIWLELSLHVLQLQLSPSSPSSLALIRSGTRLPGCSGKWPLKQCCHFRFILCWMFILYFIYVACFYTFNSIVVNWLTVFPLYVTFSVNGYYNLVQHKMSHTIGAFLITNQGVVDCLTVTSQATDRCM